MVCQQSFVNFGAGDFPFFLIPCFNLFLLWRLVLQSLHKRLPGTTSYMPVCQYYFLATACARCFPVLFCTTKLSQSTSQYYYSVLQRCTKDFPALLGTTELAQSISQHYLVLLRTTKIAQSTSQYYFVIQSLHKRLSGTT